MSRSSTNPIGGAPVRASRRVVVLLILAGLAGFGTAGSNATVRAESVTITAGPNGSTTNTTATFSFTGSAGVTAFTCTLDGGAPQSCTSPKDYSGLGLGSHLFRIRGFRGSVDLNISDSREWVVVSPDQTPPETTITSPVPGQTKAKSMTIAFTANEPSTFQCRLDGAGFAPCSSPAAYSNLSLGQHTFRVYATDAAKNSDFTPAVASWTIVGNLAPTAKIAFKQPKNRPQPVTKPLVGRYVLPLALKDAANVTGPPGAFKVVGGQLIASAGATMPKVIEGKPYTFSGAASFDTDGQIVEYEWSVWKGNAYEKKQDGPSASFTTTFSGAGGWSSVRLIVIDDEGAAGSIVLLVKVDPDCIYEISSGRFHAVADCFRRQTLKQQIVPPPKKGAPGSSSPVTVTTTRWTTFEPGSPAIVNGLRVDPEGTTKKFVKVSLPLVIEKTAGTGFGPPHITVRSVNARVSAPQAALFLGRVAWTIEPGHIRGFKLGGKLIPKLRGLRLTGIAGLGVPLLQADKSSAIALWVALPERLGGVTSDEPVVLKQSNAAPPAPAARTLGPASAAAAAAPGDFSFTVENAAITPYFTVRKLTVSYSAAADLWKLDGSIFIDALGYDALLALEIKAGSLQKIKAAIDNLNLCAAVLVCLQKLSLDISLGKTKDTYAGGIGLSLLQKVAGASIATIDGNVTLTFPNGGPESASVKGTVKLFGEIQIATGQLDTSTNGFVHVVGGMTYGFKGVASIEGKIDAWYKDPKLNAYGEIKGCVFDLACAGGQAVVSTKGIAACLIIDYEINDWRPGIGYEWGDALPTVFFASCDVGPYKEQLPQSRLLGLAAGVETVTIPAGLPGAVIAIRGATAPPKVTLIGPKGEQVTTPTGLGFVRQKPFFLVQGPPTKTTYVAIWKPSPGGWKIVPQPGSSPIVAVAHANGLPEPEVTAKVTGSGDKRTLSYGFSPRAGQVVTFWEEDVARTGGVPAAGHVIGRVVSQAGGRRQEGTLVFDPADGRGGKRAVVAQVEQDGLVRRVIRLGTYVAPSGPSVGKPSGVTVERSRGGLTITWQPGANATQYAVDVRLDDGRRIFVPVAGRRLRAVVRGVPGHVGGTATVSGIRTSTGVKGPGATATVGT